MLASQPHNRARAERVSTIYFVAGFFCLPWLWVLNAWFFWRHREVTPVIGRNVRFSAVGAVVGLSAFITYVIVMQTSVHDSSLWVIKPGVDEHQNGLFASTVYSGAGAL